jgi:uncharacterized membrane protein
MMDGAMFGRFGERARFLRCNQRPERPAAERNQRRNTMTTLTPTIATTDKREAADRAGTNPAVGKSTSASNVRTSRFAGPTVISALVATLLTGAIFGVFYAWISTTMWGLDAADPRVAIAAMQAMNANVRNAAFFSVYFLPPAALLIAAGFALWDRAKAAAGFFAVAAVVYFFGGLVLTTAIPVPMNLELAEVVVPQSINEAEAIWTDYSGEWQFWNQVRTVFCGISLALASLGLLNIRVGGSR